MTAIRRIFSAIVNAVLIFLGLAALEQSGNFLILLFVALVSVLFWVIEFDYRPGTIIYAFRYFLIRIIASLGLAGAGSAMIYIAITEPVVHIPSSRGRLLGQLILALCGPEGLVFLLIVMGGAAIVIGICMLPGITRIVSRKESTSNSSFKRDALKRAP